MRQYNTFAGVWAPTVAAADLFHEDRGLVELLVDYACAGRGISHRTVRDELAAAMSTTAEIAWPGSDTDRVYQESVTLEDGLGIGVGDVRQVDVLDIAVQLPGVAHTALLKVEETTRRNADEIQARATTVTPSTEMSSPGRHADRVAHLPRGEPGGASSPGRSKSSYHGPAGPAGRGTVRRGPSLGEIG